MAWETHTHMKNTMCDIYKHVIGIDTPIKYNLLYKCGSCLPGKMCKTPHKRTTKHNTRHKKYTNTVEDTIDPPVLDDPYTEEGKEIPAGVVGQHFYIAFGLIRGSTYSIIRRTNP